MGNGFKRFIDTSPLSLKNLNDQLEQLWLKVMGGIKYKDLDSSTKSIIEGKMDEEGVMSIIEQTSNEILMAVGKSGGDNLIKNGNCDFGIDSWQGNAENRGDCFYINASNMQQLGLKLTAGSEYTFGCEGIGNVYLSVQVWGQFAGQPLTSEGKLLLDASFDPSSSFIKYTKTFAVPSDVNGCFVKLSATGAYYLRKIYVREGKNVTDYTSNPNEMNGNGISINDEGIDIVTDKFTLNVRDDSGKVTSVLNADGGGFNQVSCNNITISERDLYSADEKTINIYVNSITGNDSNSGLSTYESFLTIARALKSVPINIKGNWIIHLSGGEYYESIRLNYGGFGNLTIQGESAKVYGNVSLNGCGYRVSISSLTIYSFSGHCISVYGCSGSLTTTSCVIDGGGVSTNYGYYLQETSNVYIKMCEMNNCGIAVYANTGSLVSIYSCKGKANATSIHTDYLSIINVEGTVPMGTVITKETNGGRIDGFLLAGSVGTNYKDPQAAIKEVIVNITSYFTYDNGIYKNNTLYQGNSARGMICFDSLDVRRKLLGKIIKSAKLVISRDANDTSIQDATIRCFTHKNAGINTGYGYVEEYGNVGTIKRGGSVSILVPPIVIPKLITKEITGFMFYDNTTRKEYVFRINTSSPPRLEVQYV